MGNFSNYWDLTTLFTKIKNKIKSVSDKIDDSVSLKSVTGNPITLTDAANANSEELSMTIEPIQSGSGDPSPTNVRPISGLSEAAATRCSFNIWDEEWELGWYDTYTGEPASSDTAIRCKSAIKVNSGLQLYLKFPTRNYKRMVIYFYDENDNFLSPRQLFNNNSIITVPANAKFLRFYMTDEYGSTYNNDICINVSDSNKNGQYEPYTAATATITFGQTVYGGSVNFKTGEVTVTHGMVDLGSLNWTTSVLHGVTRMLSEKITNIKHGSNNAYIANAICSIYTVTAVNFLYLTTYDKKFGVDFYGSIYVLDTAYTDATAFKTAMSGVQLCYELATPTTLTLTPAELELLKGNNTITANGAEISIKYYPDNAIGTLAGRVDDKADITYVDNAVATKANTADVNTALNKKADQTTVTIPVFVPSQGGWRRICKIKPTSGHTVEGVIYLGGNWSNGQPPSASIAVNIRYSAASLTLLSSTDGNDCIARRMRLVYVSGAEYWLDVFFNMYSKGTGPYKLKFTGDIAVSDIQNPISITTDATAVTDEISLNQKVSGTVLTDKSLETKYLHYISIQRYNESDNFPTYDVLIPIVNNTAATMTKTEILAYLDERGHIKPLHGMYIYRTNGNITSAEPVVDFVYSYYEGSEDKQLIFYRFEHDEHTLTTDAPNLRIEDRFVVQIMQNA